LLHGRDVHGGPLYQDPFVPRKSLIARSTDSRDTAAVCTELAGRRPLALVLGTHSEEQSGLAVVGVPLGRCMAGRSDRLYGETPLHNGDTGRDERVGITGTRICWIDYIIESIDLLVQYQLGIIQVNVWVTCKSR
jgi:hypothetical protein